MFGWKGDALQKAMDSTCYVNCTMLQTQSMEDMNKCSKAPQVTEDIDSCTLSFLSKLTVTTLT
jgi:hypothetical protein